MVFFAIVMLGVVAAFSVASLNEEVRVMKDIGLFLTSSFMVLIAVFVGVNLLYKEIERKTIYTVAPKPIFRFQFVLGKFLGLALTLAILMVILGSALAGLYVLASGTPIWLALLVGLWLLWFLADFLVVAIGSRQIEPGARGELPVAFDRMRRVVSVLFFVSLIAYALWLLPLGMIKAVLLLYVEALIVTSVALFFASFSTPILSGILALGVFAVGRFSDDVAGFRMDVDEGQIDVLGGLMQGMATICPDLTLYNTTPYVVYEYPIAWSYVAQSALYGVTYAAIALSLACVIFSRRDFV
jgi:hypothetical protein